MVNEFKKTYTAAVDIPAYSLVKFGSDDNTVTLATSATDDVIGVSGNIDVKADYLVDIAHSGIEKVKCGGSLSRGQSFYSDANGKAVSGEAGTCAGYVLQSASAEDVVLAVINRSIVSAPSVGG